MSWSNNKLLLLFRIRSQKLKLLWSILVICCVSSLCVYTFCKYGDLHYEFTWRGANPLKAHETRSTYFHVQEISMPNEVLCRNFVNLKESRRKLLVIVVLSARTNFLRRNTIRQTWGSVRNHKRWEIIVTFVLGMNEDDKLSDKIVEESNVYGDILVGNFTDTYRTLTYKTLTGFKWFLDNCSGANYILKTDDDVYIEIFQLLKHTSNLKDNNTISCHVNHLYVPQRNNTRNRWYITQDEYDKDIYPDYCIGTGYLISADVVKVLYEASLSVENIFWIEDVFVTGILREYLMEENIMQPKLLSFSRKYNIAEIDEWKNWLNTENSGRLPWIFILMWSETNEEFEEDFYSLWNKTVAVSLH